MLYNTNYFGYFIPGVVLYNIQIYCVTSCSLNALYSTFEIMLTVQLRCAIIEAMGHMSYVMLPVKLQECLPRIIPAVLGLYKKHQDQPVIVTQVN
jgi:hypothetical protein